VLLRVWRGSGDGVQLRSLALNLGLLAVSRATMTMDPSGALPSPSSQPFDGLSVTHPWGDDCTDASQRS